MSNRFYINEDEKRRISYLHKNETIRNFGRLLENVNPDIIDFFTKQTKGFKQWPKGTVIDFAQAGTKGYEVKNTDGTSYVLIPDGTAYVNDGSGYKKAENYTWTKTPYRDIPMKLEPKKATQIQSTLSPKDFKMSSGTSDETVGSSEDLKTQQTNIKSSSSKTKSEHFEKCKTWYNDYKKTKKIRDNRKTLESIASKAQENINKYLKLFDKPIKLENGETVTCRALIRIID